MIRRKKPAFIITFASTEQALAAETIFLQHNLAGRMIPVPAQISAGCGLAWKAEPDQKDMLLAALKQEQIDCAACAVLEMFG